MVKLLQLFQFRELRIFCSVSAHCYNKIFFREEVEEFFDSMDRDFDGRLSFEEFMGEESPIEKLFKNMDKNGDGLVTKQVDASIVKILNLKIM